MGHMTAPIRDLLHFSSSPLSFMKKMQATQGDIAAFRLLHQPALMVSCPNLAKKILKHNNIKKSRLVFDKITPITGEQGLVQLEGQAWSEQHTLIRPHFNPGAIESYIPLMRENLASLIGKLKGQEVSIHQIIMDYTLKNILQILGMKLHQNTAQFIDAFVCLNHLCGLRMRKLLAMPLHIPTQLNLNIKRQRAKVWQSLQSVISQGKIRKNSFIDNLSKQVSTEQLIQHISTFIFAGFETTASSLSLSLYLLAQKNEHQLKIHQECRDNPLMTLQDLKKLPHTKAFYQESLRLYPPAYMLVRESMIGQKVNSILLKKNHFIIINTYGIHRHKAHWIDPMAFNPERFHNNQTINKDAFLPFGNGQRICTGNHLAIIESILTIAELIKQFSLSSPQIIKPLTSALVTLHPRNDLWIQFNVR